MNNERAGIEEARKYISEYDTIVLNTDFDADGISCSVIGMKTLNSLNKNIHHILLDNKFPRGVSDYTIDMVFDLTEKDDKFIFLTADHGSSDMDRYRKLREERPNVIIIMTDHHLIEDEKSLEDTVDFIINPQYSKSSLNKKYSGCNVLYQLLRPFINNEVNEYLLPIVAFANLVDQMDMSDEENRKTYREAMPFMEFHPVFQTLLKATYKKRMHDRWMLMNVGPLINSSHRLGKPEIAFEFMMGKLSEISVLKLLNKDRKDQTSALHTMLMKQVKANKELLKKVMILLNPTDTTSFNGLVAGRIGNDIMLPTFVLTRKGNILKGSARSIQKIPMIEILNYINENSDCIEHYGGHHAACGITLKANEQSIKDFIFYFEKYIVENKIEYDSNDNPTEITPCKILKYIDLIEMNRPFGQGNPYPKYKTVFTIKRIQHYKSISKIKVEEVDYDIICFKLFNGKVGEKVEFIYTIEIDNKISLISETFRIFND